MIRMEADPGKRELRDELAAFAVGAPEEAAAAFDRLFAVARPRLSRYLLGLGFRPDDCEDLVQIVSSRVWAARSSFEARGIGAWWKYLQKVARNCAVDEARRYPEVPVDALSASDEIPDHDLPYLDVLLADAEDRDRLYVAADALWLGLAHEPQESRRRLLAAQLFYLHGVDWREVAQILGKDMRTARAELDGWLSDEAVLRHLAYVELYWNNHKLAGYVLRPEEPLTSAELDRLSMELQRGKSSTRLSNWTSGEAKVVLWRVRNGLLTEQILRFRRCEHDREHVEQIVDRARSYYPFSGVGGWLRTIYDSAGQADRLTETGLWRRLVFQYHCSDELPQKQILERTVPAAEAVDAKMTGAMLNGWISMNRLLAQLASFLDEGSE